MFWRPYTTARCDNKQGYEEANIPDTTAAEGNKLMQACLSESREILDVGMAPTRNIYNT